MSLSTILYSSNFFSLPEGFVAKIKNLIVRVFFPYIGTLQGTDTFILVTKVDTK